MREEDKPGTVTIDQRIDQILECGFRYAKFKLALRRNRRKHDSRYFDYSYLIKRIRDEVDELEQELINSGFLAQERIGSCGGKILEADPSFDIEKIALEAGDIICFASMICDKTEETEEAEEA